MEQVEGRAGWGEERGTGCSDAGVMRQVAGDEAGPGRELGHLPRIPQQVQNYMAACLSGRSQLTKPYRDPGNSPRLLPAQRWLP